MTAKQIVDQARIEFALPDPTPPIFTGHFPFTILDPIQKKRWATLLDSATRTIQADSAIGSTRSPGTSSATSNPSPFLYRIQREGSFEFESMTEEQYREYNTRLIYGDAFWEEMRSLEVLGDRVERLCANRDDLDLIEFLFWCYGMSENQFSEVVSRLERDAERIPAGDSGDETLTAKSS